VSKGRPVLGTSARVLATMGPSTTWGRSASLPGCEAAARSRGYVQLSKRLGHAKTSDFGGYNRVGSSSSKKLLRPRGGASDTASGRWGDAKRQCGRAVTDR
jgi:hypothetical protein